MGTVGKPPSIPEAAAARAVHIAQVVCQSPAKQTSQPVIQISPASGTRQRTGPSPRPTSFPAATSSCGGFAPTATNGALKVKSRVSGAGCPICTNRHVLSGDNDLATHYPDLARQWTQQRMAASPLMTSCPALIEKSGGSATKVTNGKLPSAPASAAAAAPSVQAKKIVPGENDLASQYPDIARQWHPEKNGSLTPEHIAPASNKKVWWICDKGHEYQATVASRTQRNGGCPYCANTKVLPGYNDLATLYPHVASQWHPTLNRPLTPDHILPGSRRKVWWQCKNGHIWQAVVYSRTGAQNSGCPFCTGYASGKRRERYERMLKEADTHPPDPLSKEEQRVW